MSNNFIYGKFIDKKICDNMIDYFEENKDIQESGKTHSKELDGPIENTKFKKCTEMFFYYKNFFKTFPEYDKALHSVLLSYQKKYKHSDLGQSFYNINTSIKIQKYLPGEGFYEWHYENDGSRRDGNRHLVFMTYLNDVDDGGTEFLYQKITTKAKKGYTLIWPAQWTHTHKGQISKTKIKYIVTGWYNYNE